LQELRKLDERGGDCTQGGGHRHGLHVAPSRAAQNYLERHRCGLTKAILAARSYEEIVLAYPSLEAIAIQRMAHSLYEKNLPLIPRMMTEWAHSRTGIDIHPGAKIGEHFFIDHGTGVVIGETCEIGARVKRYPWSLLGARSFQKTSAAGSRKAGSVTPPWKTMSRIYQFDRARGETVIGARSTIGGNVFPGPECAA
jgi:serine O-acetyltransferase